MSKRLLVALAALLLLVLSLQPASAAGMSIDVTTDDYVDNLVYHYDGSVSFSGGAGFMTISNPSSSSELFQVAASMSTGIQPASFYWDNIPSLGSRTGSYSVNTGLIFIPLQVRERFSPDRLTAGVTQLAGMNVSIHNDGTHDITGFRYEKAIPAGMTYVSGSVDDGTLTVDGDRIVWTIFSLSPGDRHSMSVSFNVTPDSPVTFDPASIYYTYHSSLAGSPSVTARTDTSIAVQKSSPDTNAWQALVIVTGASDFSQDVEKVTLYRSRVDSPFDMTLIEESHPGVLLGRGETYILNHTENYNGIPVYFARMSYSIPFTVTSTSSPRTAARTEAYVLLLAQTPTPSPTPWPSISPMPSPTSSPTIRPTWQPPVVSITPVPEPGYIQYPPDFYFVHPRRGEYVNGTTYTLLVHLSNFSDPHFIAYYSSPDGRSWTFLGLDRNLSGVTSTIDWNVPVYNGKYYLMAELYNETGLSGVTQSWVYLGEPQAGYVVSNELCGLLLLAAAIIIIPLIYFIFLRKKPYLIDMSALSVLSANDLKEISKKHGRVILPRDNYGPYIKLIKDGKVRQKVVKDDDTLAKLKADYGFVDIDARIVRLALKYDTTIVTNDYASVDRYESAGAKGIHIDRLNISRNNGQK